MINNAKQLTTHVSLRPWLDGIEGSFPEAGSIILSFMHFISFHLIWRPKIEAAWSTHDLGWE